jgi:hypothetical protein
VGANAGGQEKRVRTGSFFSMYSAGNQGGEHNKPAANVGQDLSNVGSIKEMALFSRIVNYQEQST